MPRLSADTPFLHPDTRITPDCTFGAYVEIGQGSRIAHSHIGDYSYCDRFADIANTTIGKFANIAAFVRIGPTDHPMHKASQHHFLYRSAQYWDDAAEDEAHFAARRARRASLGHDSWVGHGAIIRPEVTIGTGAVVAAGAVVTRDVAPYMIVAGVPAVPLRARVEPAIAERLMALAWWEWSHERLRAALEDFRALSAEAFVEKHGG